MIQSLEQTESKERKSLQDIFDTRDLLHTRNLFLAVTSLRKFRDCLTSTIDAWNDFEKNGIQVFGLQGTDGLRPKWDEYHSGIRGHVSEMRTMRLLVAQRLEQFNEMRDGVGQCFVGKSALTKFRSAELV